MSGRFAAPLCARFGFLLRASASQSFLATLALFVAFSADAARAAITGLQRVATGLSSPMFVTHAPGDGTRLFIGERGGTIRILNLQTGLLEPTPFLTVPGVLTNGEGGLLGMAFHPDYANNGLFYINATLSNPTTIVYKGEVSPFSSHVRQYTRSTANPNVADTNPLTIKTVITYVQPQNNHNAGWIGFSPIDGNLYIPTGDGGGGNDRDGDGDDDGHTPIIGNAQDVTDPLGKILRINVNGDDFPGDANRNYSIPAGNPYTAPGDPGLDEIWQIGMRNPFRDSFDRVTGDLWLGDVGQSSKEEIDRLPTGVPGGGNLGWRQVEGIPTTPPSIPNYIGPVYDYGRSGTFGGKTVIGGYVYRGADPDNYGDYFFADAGDFGNVASNKYWSFDPANPFGTRANIKPLLTANGITPRYLSSFGEDASGNLYIADLETNQVYRIRTNQGDYAANNVVDGADLANWQANFGTESGATKAMGDGDGDGDVDGADLIIWSRSVSDVFAAEPVSGATPEPAAATLAALALAAFAARRRRL